MEKLSEVEKSFERTPFLEDNCFVCNKKISGRRLTQEEFSKLLQESKDDLPPLAYQCQKCGTVFCEDCNRVYRK